MTDCHVVNSHLIKLIIIPVVIPLVRNKTIIYVYVTISAIKHSIILLIDEDIILIKY